MMIHAVDEVSGQRICLRSKHPRKELLDILGRSHADKMYVDTKDGTKHIGYVIGGQWWSFYEVRRWERPA